MATREAIFEGAGARAGAGAGAGVVVAAVGVRVDRVIGVPVPSDAGLPELNLEEAVGCDKAVVATIPPPTPFPTAPGF